MIDPLTAERRRAAALASLGAIARRVGVDFDAVTAIKSGAEPGTMIALVWSDLGVDLAEAAGDPLHPDVAALLARIGAHGR